jgi:hypothetical protein
LCFSLLPRQGIRDVGTTLKPGHAEICGLRRSSSDIGGSAVTCLSDGLGARSALAPWLACDALKERGRWALGC